MDPTKLFDWLTPKDEGTEEVRKWRAKVSFLLTMVILAGTASAVAAKFHFISKAEADEIHEGISRELSELKGSVEKLVTNDEERRERELLREIREVRASILDLSLRACQAENPLRASLNFQVGQLRSQHRDLTGAEYPPTPCRDLLGTP
jgi:hypothetical protein